MQMTTQFQPTPYPEINLTLHRLFTEVKAVLGEELYGMYLYGSLASGDFNSHSSDIDFLVVTTHSLTDWQVAALETLHLDLARSPSQWARKLEGSYLPLQMLPRYQPNAPPVPQINEGRFFIAQLGVDWVLQRHILREHERMIAGPSIRERIDPVTPEQIRQAVRELLRTWWTGILRDPDRLNDSAYQAYAVLSMCRALYTLQHGELCSKPVAARWALEALDPRWKPLIIEASGWCAGFPMTRLDETISFIFYSIELSL